MRVLTVVDDMGIGGTQRVAQNMSLGLSALGATVAVLAFQKGGPREAALREGGLECFIAAKGDPTSAATALELARQWAPDIIHIHRRGYTDPKETRILHHLRSDGAKVVETNVFARFDWSEGGSLIDAHFLLSKWCAFKWNAWGGRSARRKRSFILPNAVDVNSISTSSAADREQTRASLGLPPGRFVFGRVGQPMLGKWSMAIFDAFEKVLQDHDIGLLLIGTPPELREKLKTLPDHVRSRIIDVPPVHSDTQLSSLIGAMDGFLHMSAIGESFGMVLCEAMLAGVPVVTLSTPLKDNSQLEVVGHERGGLVALSPEAVPVAMSRLIGDTSLREAVRVGGRDWVASRFSTDIVSRRALDIYQTVLSDTPVNRPARRDDPDAPPDFEWLRCMLSKGIGGPPSAKTELMLRLLHSPYLYRCYLRAKLTLKGGY